MANRGNYGFSSFYQSQNSNVANSSKNLSNKNAPFSGRVISVVLDSSHPRFEELGGWSALGAIEYNPTSTPIYKNNSYPVAFPLNTNIKHFPLKNELVILQSSFSSGVDLFYSELFIFGGQNKVYYNNTISIWNHPHHNGYSFKIYDSAPSQDKSYEQVQDGSSNTISSEPVGIILGKTFKEKADIRPLVPFEGDIIYEGRWGNSIRFGSTVKDSNIVNNWSNVGNDGDPITIIRNGQGYSESEGWIPLTEDINVDETSIYLTSNQQIPINIASSDYTSYDDKDVKPTLPSEYQGQQILLNSGRLVFNSKSDHILLSSAVSINLNAIKTINIDAGRKFTVFSERIFLGKEELAIEPLLYGNKTAEILRKLVRSLKPLIETLEKLKSEPVVQGAPATFSKLLKPSANASLILEELEKQLGDSPDNCTIISKNNFTV